MKETPIIMQATSVRAILTGVKTQTRRALHRQPTDPAVTTSQGHRDKRMTKPVVIAKWPTGGKETDREMCQYGIPGDRLWVKEAWRPADGDQAGGATVVYRADIGLAEERANRWRNPLFMPRTASRLQLDLLDIRAERLNDISEADALAEGILLLNGRYTFNAGLHESRTAVESYRGLWESLHGVGSWDANPWVWVLSFRPNARG